MAVSNEDVCENLGDGRQSSFFASSYPVLEPYPLTILCCTSRYGPSVFAISQIVLIIAIGRRIAVRAAHFMDELPHSPFTISDFAAIATVTRRQLSLNELYSIWRFNNLSAKVNSLRNFGE